MDYTEKYELDVKAGNRIGRRLRALGASIAKRGGGKIGRTAEAFDPNAFDGDGDGLIQDGSQWERPVVTSSQILPSVVSAERELIPREEQKPSEAAQYSRTPKGGPVEPGASGRDELDLYQDVDPNEGAVIPTPPQLIDAGVTGVSGALRDREQELKERDHRLPGSTVDMTPEELADLAVPASFDEAVDHAATQAVGHPSQYASQADYEKALETQKAFLRDMFEGQKRTYDTAQARYDGKYGQGAFNEDSHRNKEQFRKRMVELLGDHVVISSLVGTPTINQRTTQEATTLPGLEEMSQDSFLDEVISNPNTPSWKRIIYKEIRDNLNREQLAYLNAVPNNNLIPGGPNTIPFVPTLNPLHAFAVQLLAGNSSRKHDLPQNGGDGVVAAIRNEQSELRKVPQDSWNTLSMTGEELLGMVYEDFFSWSSSRPMAVSADVKRDDRPGSFPTNEQIKARIELAARAKNIHFAMQVLFPGQTELRISRVDPDTGQHSLGDIALEARIHSDNPALMNREEIARPYWMLTHDKDTVDKMRAVLARSLRENPIMLENWRRFGVPTFTIIHPLSSGEYHNLPDDAYVSASDVLDRTPSGRAKLFSLLEKISNRGLFIAARPRNTSEDASSRSTNPFFTRILAGKPGSGANLGPNGSVGRVSRQIDLGGDIPNLFGVYTNEGIGGFSTTGSGTIAIAPEAIDVSLMTPIGISEDIIDTHDINSITHLGPAATPFHEWVHWYHEHARQDGMRILRARADQKEAEFIASGDSARAARKKAREWLKKTAYEHGFFPISNPNVPYHQAKSNNAVVDWSSFWHSVRSKYFGDDLYDKSDPDDPRSAVPMQRPVLDFGKFADYGYPSRQAMEDDFLLAMYRMHHDGFQRGGLLYDLSEEGMRANPLTSIGDLRSRRRRAANKAPTSNEGYVRTSYGQSKWQERITEASVGAFLQIFRDKPFMVNDAMLDILTTIFMRKDRNGDLTEKHGILGIRRRKRRNNGTYGRQYEEDLVPPTSTKRPITADERRGPDGHRAGLRSAGRVSAVSSRGMRFDPDERSRLRSGTSNIGLDTDERLYAFDSPVTVSDFRARSRVLNIGDHHFYDTGIPYAQSAAFRRRTTLGYIAGRVYVNRNRPHDGDMVRAISATQFGMFVDDLPTYDITTETDRAMLRGLVTGRVKELPLASRIRIETALKNATHIHSAIQGAEPNKHDLYRVVRVDPRSFVEGLVVGERIPMPITAMSRTRPSTDVADAVIRVQRGAKAIDVDDGQYLTQGTFEIVAVDMIDGQVTATLRHVETYDPRHDAMRPVDRFSDKPGAMRKFGSPRPRYTREEQQRMEVDLARRTDKAFMNERLYGLRSTGASGLGNDIDDELDIIAETTAQSSETTNQLVAKTLGRIRATLNKSIDKRLDKARTGIANKYGGTRPWVNDAKVIQQYAAYDPKRRLEVLHTIFGRIDGLMHAEEGGSPEIRWVDRMQGEDEQKEKVIKNFFGYFTELSLDQLEALLNEGRLPIYYEGRGLTVNTRKWLAANVDVSLTTEEREVIQGIRDMLITGERAYLIDGGGQSITTGSTELMVRPRDYEGINGSVFRFRGKWSGGPGDENMGGFKFFGKVLYDDPSLNPPGGDAGTFTRNIQVVDGEIVVSHDNMYMTGIPDRGAATILNQHAFQWWKQNPGTRVTLTAAMDGPIVWPRHGFHPKDQGTKRFDFDEQGVDFGTLIKAAQYIIGATSSNRQTRKRAYENLGDLDQALIQARLDRDGGRRRKFSSSSLRDNILGMTGFGDKTDADISESDMRMRERIGLWLSLAIQDRERLPGQERRASLVLLANLLDTESMEPSQKNAWKELFRSIYSGDYSIELDSVDNDPDYLPSFVISDDDPTAALIARRAAISEERKRGAALDILMPRQETDQTPDIIDPTVVTEEELSKRALQEIGERVGRLNAIFNGSRDPITGNTDPTRELLLAREITGGDDLPSLIQPYEADMRMRRAANYGQNVTRPWLNQNSNTDGVILVGITQDSRMRNDAPSMLETVRNFLTANRTMRWDNDEDSFLLDPVFTSTPDRFTERFADPNDPTVDPARNKVGLLGVADGNARWTSRNSLSLFTSTVDNALSKLLFNRDDINSPWGAISALKTVRVNGEYLFNHGYGDVYTVKGDVLMDYLDEFFPRLSNSKKSDMYSVFGMFADHLTYSERGSDREREAVKEQASWLMDLFTSIGDPRDSRRRQTMAILLGYDFLSETPGELSRSRIHVLNRGALTMVDEAVSLSDIKRYAGMSVTPKDPRSLRSGAIATTMLLDEDGAPTLLRLDDPLSVTATEMSTHAYSRLIRQDYGINPPSSLRSGGGNLSGKALKKERQWFAGRNQRREGTEFTLDVTPEMYSADIQTRMERYADLEERIEKLDDELFELDTRSGDLDSAGELTPEIDREIQERHDAVFAEKLSLEMEQKDIADTVASDINTLNNMMDAHEQREGLAYAIRKFLGEQVGLDIPVEYRKKLQDMLAVLDEQALRAPSGKDLRARHKVLQDLLDDDAEFDIRWNVTRDDTLSGETVDGVDLEDFEEDEEGYSADHWLEWIYRGFFDPSFEKWKSLRPLRWFDESVEKIMGRESFDRGKSPRRRLEDLLDSVLDGITENERRQWSREHDQLLREEYNADYEESLIDATPSDSSSVPTGVPERTWKKIIASARLARRTPYEGERDAAINTAKRLIAQHRPDLADDDYILSLRSMGSGGAQYSMISGVNLRSSELRTRGAAPSIISTPKPDRFRNILVERLTQYGVKEEDMRPDGKYGKVLMELFNRQQAQSLEMLVRRIDNETETIETDYGVYPPLSDTPITKEDKTTLKAIVTEAAKLASQSGWGILEIEGHRVKKVNGPVHSELADILGDEADIALLRTMGSPTYDQLMTINAAWARNLNRLNKMFGSYESREENGAISRVGAGLTSLSAYKEFLDANPSSDIGDANTYVDARGNVVMSVNKSVSMHENGALTPRQMVEGLGRARIEGYPVIDNDMLYGNTNDAIMGAMLLAVGIDDHEIIGTRDVLENEFRGNSRKGSLNSLRRRLAKAREQAQQMEFAPTPAGRHMEGLVHREIERLEGHIDLYERLGQRFVQMLKESENLDGEQLQARVRQMANMFSHTRGEFSNMSATDTSGDATMFESALDAFLSMQLGSPNVPRITDESMIDSGTHEIGHFVLGQGFTRHGEYISNFWPYATMGPAWWRNFVDVQRLQSDGFDRMTLNEGLGVGWTREQRELYDSLSREAKSVLSSTELVNGDFRNLRPAINESKLTKMRNDIIQKVQNDSTIGDIEKAEIVASLQGLNFGGRGVNADSSGLRKLRGGELTDEIMRTLGIYFDYDSYDEDPYIYGWSSSTPWDLFVPIDLEDLGWKRTPASGSSLRSSGNTEKIRASREDRLDFAQEADTPPTELQKEEFAHLLRFAIDVVGAPPRGYADDGIEAMQKMSDMHERRKRKAKRKLEDIVRALREMSNKYPSLKEKYKKELDNLP